MPSALHNAFLSAFVFPLVVSLWTPVPIGSQKLPEITAAASGWNIKTSGSAGGFAYLLPEPSPEKKSYAILKWKWRVMRFPTVNPKIPFEKSSDDYALRVGALLSDTEERMKVSERFEKLLQDRREILSYVVFYCAVASVPDGPNCAPNPYNDHVINCLRPAGKEYAEMTASPIKDAVKYLHLSTVKSEKLKVIGAWIFADSDNSHSASEAGLDALEIGSGP